MSRHAYMQLGTMAAVSACLAAMIVVVGVLGTRTLGVLHWHTSPAGDAAGAGSIQLHAARIARPAGNVGPGASGAPPIATPPASPVRSPSTPAHARRPQR